MMKKNYKFVIDHQEVYAVSKQNFTHINREDGNGSLIKCRRLKFIIEGERTRCFTAEISFSKVFRLDLEIEREIIKRFAEIKGIFYDYRIIKINRRGITIWVCCVNGSNTILMNKEMYKSNSNISVDIYQNIIVKNADRKSKRDNSILVGISRRYIYVICMESGKMIFSEAYPYTENLTGDCLKPLKDKIIKLRENLNSTCRLYVVNKPYKVDEIIVKYLEEKDEVIVLS